MPRRTVQITPDIDDNNNNTRRTIHEYIGSMEFMPNKQKKFMPENSDCMLTCERVET